MPDAYRLSTTLSARAPGADVGAPHQRYVMACTAMAELPTQLRATGHWLVQFTLLKGIARTGEERERLERDIGFALAEYRSITAFFDPARPLPEEDQDALAWFRARLAGCPGSSDAFLGLAQRVEALIDTTEDHPGGAPEAHFALITYAIDHFQPRLTAFVEELERAKTRLLSDRIETINSSRTDADAAITRITDISRTVSLIALNAAVEAARAGEAGRGFSVIAQEIKGLSEQTRMAASEVTGAITRLGEAL
ncbi:MAG: methyl-accepting chemotaxis protein [Pseudomonadota bacterium]